MGGPLSQIKVLDLSRVMAGPWAGQILSDLGADVIKVERPGMGDDTRSWGPPYLKTPEGKSTAESGYFLSANRGKRSITIDLNSKEGQEIVRRLALQSDILLENFKVGTLARFGLAYEDLKKVNPRLIYCSITGFGQTGPKANQVAYDFLIQAMGGLMSITGEADELPGGAPQKVGVPIVDLMTGTYATIAVLAALLRRTVSGAGEFIDIGMLDVQTAMLANQAMNYLITGNTPRRYGNGHPNIMPQQVFNCLNGAIALAVGNDGQFERLCKVLARTDLLKDKRLYKNVGRVEHRVELLGTLTKEFAKWERSHLVEELSKADVPCGPINTVPEVFNDPQVVHREMLIEVNHPLAGKTPLVASPIRFKEEKKLNYSAPPLLGQHTIDILLKIGYSNTEIKNFRKSGVV